MKLNITRAAEGLGRRSLVVGAKRAAPAWIFGEDQINLNRAADESRSGAAAIAPN